MLALVRLTVWFTEVIAADDVPVPLSFYRVLQELTQLTQDNGSPLTTSPIMARLLLCDTTSASHGILRGLVFLEYGRQE